MADNPDANPRPMRELVNELQRVDHVVFKDGWQSTGLAGRAAGEIERLHAAVAKLKSVSPSANPQMRGIDK